MKRKRFGIRRVLALLLLVLVTASGNVQPVYALKVNNNPSTVTLTEGGSQTITITLDEPIIGPGPDPAYLDINFTSSNPSRLTTSVPTVSYTASDWFASKTFTITATDDLLVNGNANITISFIVDSDSEYYNGFTGSIAVTVLDNDVAAVVTNTNNVAAQQDTLPETLQETGVDTNLWKVLSLCSGTLLTVFLLWPNKRSSLY